MYWDIKRALSYNCLFNFIIGARGVGKTYGCKEFVIKRFLREGEQFVYVRRYKDELKKMKRFFDDIEFARWESDSLLLRGCDTEDGRWKEVRVPIEQLRAEL